MSDGGRERASIGVEVWKSSQRWSVQRSVVRSIAWLDGGRRFTMRVELKGFHKKTMLSSEDVSRSTVDTRRITKAATTNPRTQASAAHQSSRRTQQNAPMKKTSMIQSRQHRDHRARQDGNQPRLGRDWE